MAEVMNSHDEAEQFKRWWRENWLSLVVGLALGLGAIVGWQAWGNYRDTRAAEASAQYERLSDSLRVGNLDSAVEVSKVLEQDYKGSAYAALGSLAVAAEQVRQGRLDDARAQLESVVNYADDDRIRQLARLRLARLQLALGQHDEALGTLDVETGKAFAPLFAELRGDVHLAKDDAVQARTAYAQALAAYPQGSAEKSFVERKLDDLAAAGGNAGAEESASEPVEAEAS